MATGGAVTKRKVATSKGAEFDHCSHRPLDREPETSPPGQVVAKPKPCPPPPSELPGSDGQSEYGTSRSTLLHDCLVGFETVIERLKKEHAVLNRLKQDIQELQEKLWKERAELEKTMTDELAKWEEFMRKEGWKMQREKNLVEKHAAAARGRSDKQERDEIQSLKQRLKTFQEDLRKRGSVDQHTQTSQCREWYSTTPGQDAGKTLPQVPRKMQSLNARKKERRFMDPATAVTPRQQNPRARPPNIFYK